MTQCSINARSFILFTRILSQSQISSRTSEGFFIEVLSVTILETTKTTGHYKIPLFQFYRSQFWRLQKQSVVFTNSFNCFIGHNFGDYKNPNLGRKGRRFVLQVTILETTKTLWTGKRRQFSVLQVTILETIKISNGIS